MDSQNRIRSAGERARAASKSRAGRRSPSRVKSSRRTKAEPRRPAELSPRTFCTFRRELSSLPWTVSRWRTARNVLEGLSRRKRTADDHPHDDHAAPSAALRPPVLRRNTAERTPVGSGGSARQAIFMVQAAQNRRRDYLRMFGKAMPGEHELIRVGRRMWNARSQAGVWTTSVIVLHPFTKDPSEVFLVQRDQPIETLATYRADQSFAEGVGLPCPGRGPEHMPSHRRNRLVDQRRINAIPIVEDEPVGRFRGDDRPELLHHPRRRGMLRDIPVQDPTCADLEDDEYIEDAKRTVTVEKKSQVTTACA